jgi:intracellular sulfur oxidation DsrE/DsrF family protein
MKPALLCCLTALLAMVATSDAADWAKPVNPAIAGVDGFVKIPNAAVMPQKTRVYTAVYDATRFPEEPTAVIPALNMAGSELNVLVGSGCPLTNAKFVIVFHGPAVDGLLTDANYQAKYHVANPNLPVIRDLKRAGVKVLVCGQHLAFANIDPIMLTRDVTVATDALIVLMTYQADGYALMSF